MLEGYVLRRRYDVSCLPTISLSETCADLLQLPEGAFTFVSGILPKGRSQVDAALQISFPSKTRPSSLLHRRHLFT